MKNYDHKHLLLQFRLTSSSWWFPSILIFGYSFEFIRFYSNKCIIINTIFVFAATMGRCQLLSLVDFVEWLIFIYFCFFFSFVFGFNNKIDICEWRIQSIKVLKQSTIIASAWREHKKKMTERKQMKRENCLFEMWIVAMRKLLLILYFSLSNLTDICDVWDERFSWLLKINRNFRIVSESIH